MPSSVRYAKSGDVHIAYRVMGDGPLDVVFVPGFVSNVEWYSEQPGFGAMGERFSTFFRYILWDKRGTGLSDPVDGVPTLDDRADDLEAVLNAVGSTRAALFGVSEGGPMALLFAATRPELVSALLLYGTTPRFVVAPDWAFGWSHEEIDRFCAEAEDHWGEGRSSISSLPVSPMIKPSRRCGLGSSGDPPARPWPGRCWRRWVPSTVGRSSAPSRRPH